VPISAEFTASARVTPPQDMNLLAVLTVRLTILQIGKALTLPENIFGDSKESPIFYKIFQKRLDKMTLMCYDFSILKD
jgi:hypothetical protein